MRGKLSVVAAVSAVAALGIPTAAASPARHGDHGSPALLRFDTMAPVTEPFTGTEHPVRGVPGGGLPWELDRARGELRADGRLKVRVEGLVLARRAPVPPEAQRTNPIPQFRAAVNCLTTPTTEAPNAADTGVTVMTDPVPASPEGDARIRAQIALPHPCIAPIVFVTSPTGAWFAATGG
jgi:hypothetical protein